MLLPLMVLLLLPLGVVLLLLRCVCEWTCRRRLPAFLQTACGGGRRKGRGAVRVSYSQLLPLLPLLLLLVVATLLPQRVDCVLHACSGILNAAWWREEPRHGWSGERLTCSYSNILARPAHRDQSPQSTHRHHHDHHAAWHLYMPAARLVPRPVQGKILLGFIIITSSLTPGCTPLLL